MVGFDGDNGPRPCGRYRRGSVFQTITIIVTQAIREPPRMPYCATPGGTAGNESTIMRRSREVPGAKGSSETRRRLPRGGPGSLSPRGIGTAPSDRRLSDSGAKSSGTTGHRSDCDPPSALDSAQKYTAIPTHTRIVRAGSESRIPTIKVKRKKAIANENRTILRRRVRRLDVSPLPRLRALLLSLTDPTRRGRCPLVRRRPRRSPPGSSSGQCGLR